MVEAMTTASGCTGHRRDDGEPASGEVPARLILGFLGPVDGPVVLPGGEVEEPRARAERRGIPVGAPLVPRVGRHASRLPCLDRPAVGVEAAAQAHGFLEVVDAAVAALVELGDLEPEAVRAHVDRGELAGPAGVIVVRQRARLVHATIVARSTTRTALMLQQELDSLLPSRDLSRRGFVKTAVGSGFAAAVLPVTAQTIMLQYIAPPATSWTIRLKRPAAAGTVVLTVTGYSLGSCVYTDNGSGLLVAQASRNAVYPASWPIDYTTGIVSASVAYFPSYGYGVTGTWVPASPQSETQHTDAIAVTLATRGTVVVRTLRPVPAPGTLARSNPPSLTEARCRSTNAFPAGASSLIRNSRWARAPAPSVSGLSRATSRQMRSMSALRLRTTYRAASAHSACAARSPAQRVAVLRSEMADRPYPRRL